MLCQKGGKVTKGGGVGNVWNAKICFVKARIKRKFINKRMQTKSRFSKFWKEFFSKCYKRCIIFLNDKVLKVVP